MLFKMTSKRSEAELTVSFVRSNYKIQQQTCPKYLRMSSEQFHFLKPGCFWSQAVFVRASCQLEPLLDSGEGNGNPMQYSCLENPMDRGGWWAAIHGVSQSQTPLNRLSSSSSRSTRIRSLLSPECGQGGALPAQAVF